MPIARPFLAPLTLAALLLASAAQDLLARFRAATATPVARPAGY